MGRRVVEVLLLVGRFSVKFRMEEAILMADIGDGVQETDADS